MCFRMHAKSWSKKGRAQNGMRVFTFQLHARLVELNLIRMAGKIGELQYPQDSFLVLYCVTMNVQNAILLLGPRLPYVLHTIGLEPVPLFSVISVVLRPRNDQQAVSAVFPLQDVATEMEKG